MIKNATCLYEGQLIGIESIFTRINGKCIHIPEKKENLRTLSREKKLFCPCGCGNNLTLIAGDKSLRVPHFRMQKTLGARKCIIVEEDEVSIVSKMILKCWIDSKLESNQIECRVPINRIFNTNRKFEYSFYDYKNKIGICYWHKRTNIESEKIATIEKHSAIKSTIYVTDISNSGFLGQYPEYMIKIQKEQGFVLYLKCDKNSNYEDVYLMVSAFAENHLGEWEELEILHDKLDVYDVSSDGRLIYQNKFVNELAKKNVDNYKAKQKERITQSESQYQRKISEEQNEIYIPSKVQKDDSTKASAEEIEEKYNFNQNSYRIYDSNRTRLLQCIYCKKVAPLKGNFYYYDNKINLNMGTCNNCKDLFNWNTEIAEEKHNIPQIIEKNHCPLCNCEIIEKNTPLGRFRMCVDYPLCSYREKI